MGFLKKDKVMRTSTIFAAFAAALTLASCAKETANTPSAPEEKGRTILVKAQAESSKSVFSAPAEGVYPVVWTANDTQIGVSVNNGAIQQIAMTPEVGTQNTAFTIESVPETAQFTVVSPYSAFKGIDGAQGRVSVNIPATQISSAASTDEAAQVLVAQSENYSVVPESITLSFRHAAAYLHLQISNAELLGGELESVTFATSSTGLVGDFYYKPSDRSFTAGASMASSVTAVTSTLDNVWMAVAPVDLSGETVTVTVTTSLGRLIKHSTFGSGKQLQSGKIIKLAIDMADAERPDDEVYNLVTAASQLNVGDKIVIVSANADEAISTTQKTNNRASVAVTRVGDKVYNPAESVEIIELADGLTAGTFALRATKTAGYLYAGNVLESGSNILQTRSGLNMQGTWTVDFDENTAWIVSQGSAYHNTIGYNGTDHLLTAYTGLSSASRHIKVYRLRVDPVVSDRFGAVMPMDEMNYEAAEVPVYVTGNVSWTATLTGDATFKENGSKSFSGSGFQTLTLDVAQNDGASEKEYVVTVTTAASVSPDAYTLTLTQGTKKAGFPIQWSMPAENNVSGVDYSLNNLSGSYVYSDTHEGKMSVIRVSTTEKTGNNTTYGARPASETRWGGKHCLLHYGVYKEDYWLFEVYNVDNPAGSYTLDYWMESSGNGPKYFLLEYSIDEGATWTKVPGYQTTSYDDGKGYTEDTVEYTYAMPAASTIVEVSQAITLPAVQGSKTLMFRARVTSASRVSGSKMAVNHGATSRVGDHVTISFTPAN